MSELLAPDAASIISGLEKRISRLENPPGTATSSTSTIAQNLAITGLSGVATYYLDSIGIPRIKITWSWTGPSTASSDDPTFDPAHHFVVWYVTPTLTSAKIETTDTSFTVDYAAAGTNYTFNIYAVSGKGRIGTTAQSLLNSSKDNTAPNQPSTPTVTPQLKALKIVWNGLDVTAAAMAADFAYCEVHTSTSGAAFTPSDATRTPYRLMQFSGTIVIPTENYTLTYVRLVPVDVWGNKGVASTAGSATPSKAVDTDLSGIALPGDIAYRDEGNLVPDGSFESQVVRDDRMANAEMADAANISFVNTAGFAAHGSWAIKFAGSVSNKMIYLNGHPTAGRVVVEPNTKLYVSAKIRGISANGTIFCTVRFRDAASTATLINAFSTASSTGSYVFFEGVVTVPSDAVTAELKFQTASHTTGDWYFDQVQMRHIIGTELIEDAAITNAKIANLAVNDAKIVSLAASKITTAELAAGARIIAGSQTTGHAEMRPEGFITYVLAPVEGIVVEAARLGVGGSTEALAISSTSGDVVAGISQTGSISGLGLSILQDPVIDGKKLLGDLQSFGSPTQGPLVGHFDKVGRGVVGFGQIGATSYLTADTILMTVSFQAKQGRSYLVTFSGAQIRIQNANVTTGLYLRLVNPATKGGVAANPTTANGVLLTDMWTSVPAVGAESHSGGTALILRCNWETGDLTIGGELVEGTVRLAIGIRGDRAGGAAITDPQGDLVIQDIGPDIPETGVPSGSGVQRAYTSYWVASASEAYNGLGGLRTDTTDLVQGYISAHGDCYAHIVFGAANSTGSQTGVSVATAMTGATLLRARIWLYAKYWTYNTGGYAVMRPSTSAALTNAPVIQGTFNHPMAKPSGAWIDMTGIATTATRSVQIGQAGGTNQLYYGRFASHLDAVDYKPVLELTYTK